MSDKPLIFNKDTPLFGNQNDPKAPEPTNYNLSHEQVKNMTYLGGLFLELTRMAWSRDNIFMYNTQQQIRWEPNGRNLAIDLEYNFSSDNKEFPCIIGVKIPNLEYTRAEGAGKDDRVEHSYDMGTRIYSRIAKGGAMLVHVGQSNGQTIDMADGTEEFFTVFGPVIKNKYGFINFNVVSRSQLQPQDKEVYGNGRYISVVNLGYTFEVTWSLKEESPKLRELFNITGHRPVGRNILNNSK